MPYIGVPTCVPLYIAGKLFRELRQVHVVGRGPPEDLRVRGPAQALITLRAIRGHADEVGALSPEDVAPQLVDHRAAGVQLYGKGRVGVQGHRLHGSKVRLIGQARHFDIAEAVKRKVRLKLLLAFAGKNIVVGRFRRAQVVDIEGAVRIQHFCEAQLNVGTRGASHAQPLHSGQVLAEVVDIGSRFGVGDGRRGQCLVGADGLEGLRNNFRLQRLDQIDLLPMCVGKAGRIPTCLLFSRIVTFAVVDLRLRNRRYIGLPGSVGRDPLHRAIRMLDAQLRLQSRRSVSIVVSLTKPHQRSGVPARREPRPNRVVPGLQLSR